MKPNIIIVMTDQQRADLRKSCGYPLDTMPFLDSWAQQGVDFSRAYTPNPTCMPARVSMLTGRYPECHKARTNHNVVDALYTDDLLDVLKKNGYKTALCGKNHSHRKPSDFDFCVETSHLGAEPGQHLTEDEHKFDVFLKTLRFMDCLEQSPGDVSVQLPYRNVSSAFKFIDSCKGGKSPFFTWISMAEPHNPYQVPKPYYDLFPPENLPKMETSVVDLAAKGPRYPWIRSVWEKVMGFDIDKRIQRVRSNYLGMLRLIDDQFKRLIEGLVDRGLDKNTIVVFLADHGDFAGEYGLIRKGPDLPEVLTRIPLIWRGVGITPQGSVSAPFVNLVDILPTICDIIGTETPFGVQGKSIFPLLRNADIPAREYDVAYSESGFSGLYWNEKDSLSLQQEGACRESLSFDCLNTWTQCGQVRMLRKNDYKIQMDMLGTGYLYNLKNDPFETHNLWNDNSQIAVKVDLLAELTAAMLRACDPIPAPHHRYRTKIHPRGFWFQDYTSTDPGVREVPLVAKK